MPRKRTISLQMDAWEELETIRKIRFPTATTYTELVHKIAKEALKG